MNILKCSCAIALLSAVPAAAAVDDSSALSKKITVWFENELNDVRQASFSPDIRLDSAAVDSAARMVWNAWKAANAAIDEERLPQLAPISPDSASWTLPPDLEPNAVMTFRYGSKGEEPAAGYPLFLYLHGSGEKNREWANGYHFASTFDDAPSVYFVPRIPNTGEWYRWYQRSKQAAWEKMLRQAFVSGYINPDRVYFFGISEGGYGSQRLASFYADYLAGAGPMAGGEPLANAPVENCRNMVFSLRTGAEDHGFYREKLTRRTAQAFDSLSALHPGEFHHWIELIPGRGHAINYSPTTPWLKGFARNPYPKAVNWENFEMDGRKRTGFYNLAVQEPDTLSCRMRYDMEIEGNDIRLTADRVSYRTTETDPRWGIALDFERTYTPATSGVVTVYLNSSLVDLGKPVRLTVNGKEVYDAVPELSLDNLVESCAEFFDPRRLFPAKITVNLADL